MYETLASTDQKFNPEIEAQFMKYVYKTGAVYEGEMRGGFRDGRGKMTWSDQAYYEGEWSMGYASG